MEDLEREYLRLLQRQVNTQWNPRWTAIDHLILQRAREDLYQLLLTMDYEKKGIK